MNIASAPQIVSPAGDGARKFLNQLFSNGTVKGVSLILGGIVVVVCVALILIRKFWPSTQIGNAMNSGGHTVTWCIVGIVLGVLLAAPTMVAPWLVELLATPVQWVLDLVSWAMGV